MAQQYQYQQGYQQGPAPGYQQGLPPGYQQQQQQQPYPYQQQAQPADPVQAWFQSVDTDRSGQLDSRELQRALAMGNLQYGLNDVDQMVRAFNTSGTRKLNVQEFGKLHQFLASVQNSFSYFDRDGSRTLQNQEIGQALEHAGFKLDPPVLQSMLKKYDPDNNGVLSLDEYIRMCLFLQSVVRAFSAFDPERKGTISLNFNQFVYATSYL